MGLNSKAQGIFETACRRSEGGIARMREVAAEVIGEDERFIVGVNGSYARREATSGSDVDLFVLYHKDARDDAQRYQSALRDRLEKEGFKMPAPGGVFSSPLAVSFLSQTIGGMEDTNEFITRRMLLLLEGEWLYNQNGFDQARDRLLGQYVTSAIRSEQICLFLLNDIIRYWRTICVDFEFKVQSDGKPREIRLIKLRFSRMLLFFAGVLAVGQTFGLDREEKISRLATLLALPAHQRIVAVAGESAHQALELYAEFLEALDDSSVREALSGSSSSGEESEHFTHLRKQAHEFRGLLLNLLETCFPKENPTVAALML